MYGINKIYKICHCIAETRVISGISRQTPVQHLDLVAYSPHINAFGKPSLPICSTTFQGPPLHPECIQKCLPRFLAFLRTRGIHITGYLNDLLLKDSSATTFSTNIQRMIRFLSTFSWAIFFPESALQPSYCLEYLDLFLDTTRTRIFLLQVALLRSLRSKRHPSVSAC